MKKTKIIKTARTDTINQLKTISRPIPETDDKKIRKIIGFRYREVLGDIIYEYL